MFHPRASAWPLGASVLAPGPEQMVTGACAMVPPSSADQGLEMARGRGVELGPVQLFLDAMIGFVSDAAPPAQLIQLTSLGLDRPHPQPVEFRRGLRLALVLGHLARRR